MTKQTTGATERPITYAYRPSAFGPIREFRLSDDGIDWVAGIRSGHVPYRNIRHLRMSYRPTSMQSHRFVTELWAMDAPKLRVASSSWKSLFEQERLDRSYSVFVVELHHRISSAAIPALFQQGSSPLIYWPSLLVFVAAALALAILIVRALQIGALGGAGLVGAFLALFLWQGGNFIRRNRPGIYRAHVLPKDVMP